MSNLQNSRVYIGKVSGLQSEDIKEVCEKSGTLVDFMMKDNFAFAEFENEQQATQAILELDGRSIKGIRIFAQYAKKKQDLDQNYFASHPRIYVGRLPRDITKEVLLAEFGKFGKISDILKKNDYAFIEFEEAMSAQQAIEQMNGHPVQNNRIVVEGARPKETGEKLQYPRLYIGKLGPLVKKSDIVNAFGSFGQILDIVMKDDYAFLEYQTTTCAARALAELNGSRLQGSKITVEEAKPKDGQVQIKKLPLNSQKVLDSIQLNSNQQMSDIKDMKIKTKGRRLSPRRSISRSRSRSQENVKPDRYKIY